MILPVIGGLVLLAILILVAERIEQVRVVVVRHAVMRVLVILLLLLSLFLWARHQLINAVGCSPDCIGVSLVGRDLEGADLRNSDFAEANLRGASLHVADLYNTDFAGANLNGVNFQNANLRSARFTGARLNGADFRGAIMGDTDLRGAELEEADLTKVDLTRVHLEGVIFNKAKLVEANLNGKNLAGISFLQADLTGAQLSNADLSGSRLSGANLSGAVLTGSDLAGAWLNLADLTGADLRGANLSGANLLGANLASADLSNSQLIGASLIGAHVNGTDLRGANLTGIRFLATELFPVDLLTDPLLQVLNQLQLAEVVADVDFSGIRFNRETKWPLARKTVLAEMLGPRFFDLSSPTTAQQGSGNTQTALVITGNTSALPLSQAIYTKFVQDGNTQQILLDSVAANDAFTAFCTNPGIHLIAANRPFPDNTASDCAANQRELITFTVGIEALAVVGNNSNEAVTTVTADELMQLQIANRWSDVNLLWPRETIQRFISDGETVTRQFWSEKVFQGNLEMAQSAFDLITPLDNTAQLVQGVINDPYALGILDYTVYRQNASALKLLAINDQFPSTENISQQRYTFTQPLYLFADANQLRQLPALQDFLAYYFANANTVVDQIDLFPAAPEALAAAKATLATLQSSSK